MRELFRITIYFDPARTGENEMAFKHKGTEAKIKKAAILAAQKGWQAARCPVTKPEHWPVTVDVIIRRGRRLDSFNSYGALKWLIDGVFAKQKDKRTGWMVPGLATPDDSNRYLLAGRTSQETGARWKGREEVIFIVSTRDDKTGDEPLCNSESKEQTWRAGWDIARQP